MLEAALVCRNLVKRYPDVVAVDGLDLEVTSGECFGLLGPNGAGKTTTVEIFEGLLKQDEGTVEVLGHDWNGNTHALRERLGIQLQESKMHEKLSVIETITLFRSFYRKGLDPSRVLGIVGLEEKARAWVGKLSGGQQQRLSLACALVADPEVLFLDEPTTGLDPQSRRRIWEVVEESRARGVTVLLTTHYMEEAQRLCDRVAIVDQGKKIALGSPAELIASLHANQVVEFETRTAPDLEPLRGLVGVSDVRSEGAAYRMTVEQTHHTVPALLDELTRQGAGLERLATHQATLEDVFVTLTGRHLRDE